jgi:hypothetical protein
MNKNKISDFLTPDISYLLGLITGRGEIQSTNDIKKIVIDFEFKALQSKAITKVFDQKLHIQTSLDPVILRLQNIGIKTKKIVTDTSISISLTWETEDISWLFIKFLINGTRYNFHDFAVPEPIFETTETNKKEFLRGLSDVTGYVRASNYEQIDPNLPKRYRVYIEISNRNWFLPPQICQLMQSIGVPINTINYGHPNLRDPQAKDWNKNNNSTPWAKEHQIKIYAEEFEEIGFYISHKQEALNEMALENKQHFQSSNLCTGISKRTKTKASHPHENHQKIPIPINGCHFNGFREICKCVGCYLQK